MNLGRLRILQVVAMIMRINRISWALLFAILCVPAIARAQDEVVYYHTDAIGSVRMVTDASGAVVARYDYLPFGEPWPTVPPNPNPDVRQFTGKERDAETGLDYFGARYLRAQSGRFTTVDPVIDFQKALTNPQLWNRYAYSINNPFRFIDPDGRQVLDANLQRMLELLKAPVTAAGHFRGPLIQEAARAGVETVFGELFGYRPMAFGGGLSQHEYALLTRVSSHEKGAWMLGVGPANAPGIDAVDLTHGRGISLKTASSAENVRRNAEQGVKQVAGAGFYDVHMFVDARTITKADLNHGRIQGLINDRVTRIVVFTKDGPVEYR